jgi:RNA polymerase sigma-70 factor (ECF subfamily)
VDVALETEPITQAQPNQPDSLATLDPSTAAWLFMAQAGETAAFDAIQQEYEPAIRNFVRRLIGDYSQPYEVDDIVQDVFLALYTHLADIDPPEKLRPYLYRVARNRCYDVLRQLGRCEFTTLDDDLISDWVTYQAYSSADDAERPEDLAHWLLLHLEVQEAMLRLPETQRQALMLYADEGLSYTEIADVMNTSVGTVKSRIYYAKRALRGLLRPDILMALDAEFKQEALNERSNQN